MASAKASIIAVGTVIDVLEAKTNDAGTLRIRFSGGWVSEYAGNGATCFEAIRNELGAPPASVAPVPEPAPEPETPLVVTVKEEDMEPGEYKCVHQAIIREGPEMDAAKAGSLDVNERIDVLETKTLESGLVRCRFVDGWISAQLNGGEPILERTFETSGETVKCGECTLSKEVFTLCKKMTRTSRLKNKAIIMKINRKQMEIVMVEELDDVTPVRYPTFVGARTHARTRERSTRTRTRSQHTHRRIRSSMLRVLPGYCSIDVVLPGWSDRLTA